VDSKRILVIEDDSAIRKGLVDAMEFSGYQVLQSADGGEGKARALSATFDLLLLDLILPNIGGFEILEAVKDARPTLPVIILTARGEENERVRGLQMGADDYIVKPFSVRELLARVEAVLRRSPERPKAMSRIALGDGVADLARNEARFQDGKRVDLSDREVELLRYLASHSGRVISRQEILLRVWRLNPNRLETRTIDMHVAKLREKLRDDPAAPKVLLTVRGKGYMIAASESSDSGDSPA